jgi:hypothetical protein
MVLKFRMELTSFFLDLVALKNPSILESFHDFKSRRNTKMVRGVEFISCVN